ncbi:MAG: hypothetical protein DME23_09040 [Verrucomicrobia bacterium]|nr:MAG: hypothetical protein DME23_09040 [Verrucomicrobiota bacterium]
MANDSGVKAINNLTLEAKRGLIMLLLQFPDKLICDIEYNLNVIGLISRSGNRAFFRPARYRPLRQPGWPPLR